MDAPKTDMEVSQSQLWHDDESFVAQTQRTIAAIARLRDQLADQQDRSAQEREFLRLAEWAFSCDAGAFERVFEDPSAFHWADRAESLSNSLHRDHQAARHPRLAYHDHLQQFSLFAIGLAHVTGRSICVNATRLNTPVAIPATPWSISNDHGETILHGIKDGKTLHLSTNRRSLFVSLSERTIPTGAVTIHRAPDIETPQGTIRMQPHLFHLPGVDLAGDVLGSTPESQVGLTGEVESAIAAIESYDPESARQIGRHLKTIVMQSPESYAPIHGSCPSVPGAVTLTESRHPLMLADDLLQEFYRFRFATLVEFAQGRRQALQGQLGTGLGRLRSTYTFERVLRFWLAAIESQELGGSELEYAVGRAAELDAELQLSLVQTQASRLSPWGRDCLRLVHQSVMETGNWVGMLGVDIHVPASRRVDSFSESGGTFGELSGLDVLAKSA